MAPVTLILKPVVREKKSLAWDSAGAARGDDCRMRACRKLARLPASTKPSDGELAAMREVACDASETERRWWTRTFESRAAARRRGHDLLHALSASPHATVVVVSHSIFLRELFSNFLTAAASDETRAAAKGALADAEVDLPRVLRTRKLPNCGVVACELVAQEGGESAVAAMQLTNARCWVPDGSPWRPHLSTRRTTGFLCGRPSGRRRSAKVTPFAGVGD